MNHKLKKWLKIFGIWFGIGFVSSLQSYYYRNIDVQRYSFAETVVYDTTFYVLWAFLTPLILIVSKRYRIEMNCLLKSVGIHLITGLLIGFFQRGVFNFIFMYAEQSAEHPFYWEQLLNRTIGTFDVSVLIYFAVVFVNNTIEYYEWFQEQSLKSAELKSELANAQLDALRMQLQPHFLFNTLNAVAVLIEYNPKAARQMVNLLSDLLRQTLENHQEREVSLQTEMEFIDRYLQIYKIRFGDRLTVDRQVETDVLDAMVPCLILQPIVENAMRHGIENIPGSGIVRIKAFRTDSMLQLQISDSGPGLENHDLTRINHLGLGLRNTQKRLTHLYGELGCIDISNSQLGGLEVTIIIPYHTSINYRIPT